MRLQNRTGTGSSMVPSSEKLMYGGRARIGYACPVAVAEVFPYDFYQIVPPGVALVTSTASVWHGTPEEMKRSAGQSIEAVSQMCRAGVDLIVFGGVPVGYAADYPTIDALVEALEAQSGIPVTASLLCQNRALAAIQAKEVVVLRPGSGHYDRHMQHLSATGYRILEVRGMDHDRYTLASLSETYQAASNLLKDHPSADTLYCPSPHWRMVGNIDMIEQAFGVSVITSGQAIVWDSLRRLGIADSIQGYGRLLREF